MSDRTVTIPLEEYEDIIQYYKDSCVCVQSGCYIGDTYYQKFKSKDEVLNYLTEELNIESKRRAEYQEECKELGKGCKELEKECKELKEIKAMTIWQFIKWRKK